MNTLSANFFLAMSSPNLWPFIIMTLVSIMILLLLPHKKRHHVRKAGTYFHELSHGIASLATGGNFHQFYVHSNAGGVCLTSGGNHKITALAGYVGTILLGSIFLARSAQNQSLVIMLQVVAVAIAFSTIKAGDIHTAAIGVIVASVLALFSTLFPGSAITRFLMNLMGVILLWQGIYALIILLRLSATQENTGSDAEFIAEITDKDPFHWALIIAGISVVIIMIALRLIINS